MAITPADIQAQTFSEAKRGYQANIVGTDAERSSPQTGASLAYERISIMAITPADIQAQTFSEAKRGYDPAEVDVFLEQLASEVDAMLNKIVDLKTRLTATEQELAAAQAQAQVAVAAPAPAPAPVASPEYTATASQITAALIAAQQSADNIVAEARENADRIRNEADAKAREVIRQALNE